MKRTVLLVLVLVSTANPAQVGGQNSQAPQGTPVTLTQLGPTRSGPRWSYSGSCFREPMRIVVRDSETWQETWTALYDCGRHFSMDATGHLSSMKLPPPPEIDFAREMLIVAAMGMRPTGGYGIIIESASDRGDRLELTVRSISPGCGLQTQSVTSPLDVVRLAKSEHPIVFREIKAVMVCPDGGLPVIRDVP